MSRPYTVTFGPWSPDLQNVGVEISPQSAETELPVADCENVYYQDAAYRCIPAPASIGPSLGTPITNAYTWYDETDGKEVVFATTANGIFQLVDGVWSAVPITLAPVIGGGAVGKALMIQRGAVTAVGYTVTPQSQTASGSSSSHVFSAVNLVVGETGAGSYSWGVGSPVGGTWSTASGQGTTAGVPQVTGVAPGATATATYSCFFSFNGHTYSSPVCTLSYKYFAPTLRTYTSGSGHDTAPAGATNVIIEVWGGGEGGQGGYLNSGTRPPQLYGGQGGTSGAYTRSSYAVSGGQTIAYAVGGGGGGGAGGTPGYGSPGNGVGSSASSGTLSITTMTSPGGGTGGSPSGGNQANTASHTGTAGGLNSAGAGGAGATGLHAGPAGAGGNGGLGSTNGVAGVTGLVSFYYT